MASKTRSQITKRKSMISEDEQPQTEDKEPKKLKELHKPNESELQHKAFHIALKKANLPLVEDFIKKGIKLCYENKEENCYILAQKHRNQNLLKILLEYDSIGVNNAINSENESLLMVDIKEHKCRHFELLIEKGADINYCEDSGYTPLHYATSNHATPFNVIQKLIELKANVNKALDFGEDIPLYHESLTDPDGSPSRLIVQDNGDGDTPLICLLKNYKNTGIKKKITLLVESGADVNLKNKINRTPLMYAAEVDITVSKNRNLIKYLIDNGAKGGMHDLNGYTAINDFVCSLGYVEKLLYRNLLEDIVDKYYIPSMNALILAEEDIFQKNIEDNTPLCNILELLNRNRRIQDAVIHLIELAFASLCDGFQFDKSKHLHPMQPILSKFNYIQKEIDVLHAVGDCILYHPTNEFKCYPPIAQSIDCIYQWDCLGIYDDFIDMDYDISVVGTFTKHIPLLELKYWLISLKRKNFDFKHEFPLLFILLMRSLGTVPDEPYYNEEQATECIDYVLGTDNPICSTKLHFVDDNLNSLQILLEIPDCVWISSVFGKLDYLKKFIPYWNQHPLAVLLFLRPWLESQSKLQNLMLNSISAILPYLIEIGGPLSHGSKLHYLMSSYMEKIQSHAGRSLNLTNTNNELPKDKKKSAFAKIYLLLQNTLKSPASLKVLSRTVIRVNAVGHGNNLPNYLSSLVPSAVLKNFITLKSDS